MTEHDVLFVYRLTLLSAKELRAAVLYADGLSNSQVMKLLGSTNQTRTRLLRKLALARTRELKPYRRELHIKAGVLT